MTNSETKLLTRVICLHAARYPLMEPTDAVKLVYQSVFGGGHLIQDTQASLLRLSNERAAANALQTNPFVEIGNGRARMHLASPALSALPDALLNRMFVLSARAPAGDIVQFHSALNLLSSLARDGLFRFDSVCFEDYLRPYVDSDCPMVSHSETYRQAYHPSYRVVDAIYTQLLPTITAVQSAIASGASEAYIPLTISMPAQSLIIIQTLFEQLNITQSDVFGRPPLRISR